MNNLVEYIWSAEGHKCIAIPSPKGVDPKTGTIPFWHYWFDNAADARVKAMSLAAEGRDVYWAPTILEEKRRLKVNAKYAAVLWADLDVKSWDDKAYATFEEADQTITNFCTTVGIPQPVKVCSGYGLHCYWVLDKYITPAQWQDASIRLRKLMTQHGVKQDAQVTGNPAALLRYPDTFNFKYDQKVPVYLYQTAGICDSTILVKNLPTTGNFDYSAYDVDEVATCSGVMAASKCAQLKGVASSRGDVAEPLWYAAIGLASYTTEGVSLAHAWSSGHPQYDKQQTDSKVSQWRASSSGPATCQHFESVNPSGCDGCPFRGQITSPISLGQDRPLQVGPYVIKDYGVLWTAGETDKDANGKPKPARKIVGVPMTMLALGQTKQDDTRAVVEWKTPTGVTKADELYLRVLGEPNELQRWLLDRGIVQFNSAKEVAMYLNTYAEVLAAAREPDTIAAQFGWQKDGKFVLGDYELTSTEARKIRLDGDEVNNIMRQRVQPKGDLVKWVAATALLDRPEYAKHSFAVLAALASPLIKIAGWQGCLLSLAGPTNTGKTTAWQFGMSAFYHPDTFKLSPTGTTNSKDAFFKLANNLPVLIDDVSGKHTDAIEGLILTAVNGVAKERLDKNSKLKDQASWCTIIGITTNNPIMDLPATKIIDAEKRRAVEILVDQLMDKDTAEVLNVTMAENYGLIGKTYIQYVLKNKESVKQMLLQAEKNVSSLEGIDAANRFGIWMCAAATIAGQIATHLGLIKFNIKPALAAGIDAMRDNIKNSMSHVQIIEQAIGEYLDEYRGNIPIRYTSGNWDRLDSADRTRVRGAVKNYDQETGTCTVHIPTGEFQLFLVNRGVDTVSLRMWSDENSIRKANSALVPDSPSRRHFVIPYTLTIKDNL